MIYFVVLFDRNMFVVFNLNCYKISKTKEFQVRFKRGFCVIQKRREKQKTKFDENEKKTFEFVRISSNLVE